MLVFSLIKYPCLRVIAEQYPLYSGSSTFSRYVFEELEIYHLGSSMANFLHMHKSIVEINFGNARHWRFFLDQNNELYWRLQNMWVIQSFLAFLMVESAFEVDIARFSSVLSLGNRTATYWSGNSSLCHTSSWQHEVTVQLTEFHACDCFSQNQRLLIFWITRFHHMMKYFCSRTTDLLLFLNGKTKSQG